VDLGGGRVALPNLGSFEAMQRQCVKKGHVGERVFEVEALLLSFTNISRGLFGHGHSSLFLILESVRRTNRPSTDSWPVGANAVSVDVDCVNFPIT
jgi:hypothetical protein